MLKTLSGQQVSFFTTVGFSAPGQSVKLHTEEVIVTFRQLEEAEILRYVARDQPLDCAGSFKVESLGIGLFDAVESRDPTALEGLPLIKLCQWLRDHGFRIP
jgi:septum formation protein